MIMEKSLLLQFVGDSPLAKIMDVLIDELGMDLSKKDIAERAELSRTTVFNHWPALEKFGVVKETRRFGKTKLYALNRDNQIVQNVLALEYSLIKADLGSGIEKEVLAGH